MTITDSMYQLGQAARRLNEGSDQLNRVLARIEETLGRLMIGMEYVHPRPLVEEVNLDADGKRIIELDYLGYLKVGGRFRLAIKQVKILESRKQGAFQAPGQATALLEAPRRIRHLAVDQLGDLVGGLAAQVDDVLGQMERRCEVATNVLAHLESMLVTESGSFQRDFDARAPGVPETRPQAPEVPPRETGVGRRTAAGYNPHRRNK